MELYEDHREATELPELWSAALSWDSKAGREAGAAGANTRLNCAQLKGAGWEARVFYAIGIPITSSSDSVLH